MIIEDFAEVLTDVTVDKFHFRVTWNPARTGACIMWFWDGKLPGSFRPLGQFTRYEKRNVLEFIARYATSKALRDEIEKRRFEQKVEVLQPDFFEDLEKASPHRKRLAYRDLFNLDSMLIARGELDRRRRVMARRFHPDAGGSDRYMTMINEAYDFLVRTTDVL